MLKAKRKRLREEQESMDVDDVTHPTPPLKLSEGMNCNSTKRARVDLAAASVLVLKEEVPVDISTHVPTEVSKLDPPPVKKPPARYVDFGAVADLMSSCFGEEGQDDKEKRTNKSFEERIEDLTAFKAKHGHVRVNKAKHDESLSTFCTNMRCARRTGTTMIITEDRIKALDELGFDWGEKNTAFEERIEELKTFKAKHGHVRVTMKQDKSLGRFCKTMRADRRGTRTGKFITEDRSKALDELGFD